MIAFTNSEDDVILSLITAGIVFMIAAVIWLTRPKKPPT